jgi:hypothetical protein
MNQATQTPKPEGRLVRFLLAALVALICGVGADVVLVLPYAFSSEPWRMWFAAFGIGALFSALVAGWVGTLGASDRTRSRLLIVVGTSEAAAAILAVGGFLYCGARCLAPQHYCPYSRYSSWGWEWRLLRWSVAGRHCVSAARGGT